MLERIRKLESSGIIRQYTVTWTTRRSARTWPPSFQSAWNIPHNANFIECVQKDKRIAECHYITGDFDFLLKVVTHSTEALEATLNTIKNIAGVSLTKTLVVFSTLKQDVTAFPDQP